MRKLFLIPLMTLVCSVMAWGADVAETGGEKYSSLQAAINAAEPEATVTLLTNTSGNLTLSKDVRLAGDKTLSNGKITVDNDITVTLAGFNVSTTGDVFDFTSHTLNIIVEDGTTNSLKTTGYNDVFAAYGGDGTGTIRVSGNGVLYAMGYEVILAYYVYIDAPNMIIAAHDGYMIWGNPAVLKECILTGGYYRYDPSLLGVADGYLLSKADLTEDEVLNSIILNKESVHPSGIYTKIIPQGNVKVLNKTQLNAYESGLSEAAADAVEGDYLIMYADDATNVAVGKNIEINKNGHSVNVSATDGRTKYETSERVLISNNALVAYLQGNSSEIYTISTEDLTSAGGQIFVNGEKTISIPENITLNCVYQDAGFSIIVPNGAKLSLVGKGTIATDRSLIQVAKGGELVVGSSENSDALTFTTSYNSSANVIVENHGKATLYNVIMHAKSAALGNYGVMDIFGGLYTGKASTTTAARYCITSDVESQLYMKNVTVKGVHGALACQGLDPQKKSAVARIEDCDLQATDTPNGESVSGSVHYGLYTATTAIVSAYNTKFSSTDKAYAICVGNNDAMSTFGLVYLYDGCMVKAKNLTNKIRVSKKSASDNPILFPVSIDSNSDWYKAAENGGEGPLPAGYQWEAIASGADYDAGYRWKVVSTATKESDATGTTIPWQQNTTWTDTETPKVPDQNTAVSIPEGKIVVVDKDQANKNAEAEQIFIGGEGASLTVQDGTTLNVENGVNIADGGNLVVNAGAMVTIGAGGLVTASDDAVKIEMTEGQSGIFMIAPGVKENTHPMAKVELVSKAYYITAEDRYVWQRFGIPAYMEGMTKANVDYDHVAYPTAWMKIEHQNWADFEDGDVFKPFTCYGLTTNATTAGAVYTFSCPLMGNGNAELDLTDNWNYYANSYTAPISIRQMLADFKEHNPNVSGTVYLYRAYDNWWYEINNAAYAFEVDENNQQLPEQIDPMQAFIFQRRAAGDNPVINYKSQIWDPIMEPSTPAPARVRNFNKAMVVITAQDGTKDMVRLIEGNQFSTNFDNTYDATKYMKDNSFNLFANANNEKLGTIASDNLEGTMIGLNTKGQTSFTMSIKNANGMNYAIRDMLTGTETDIVDGATYMFSVPADTNVEDRFMIVAKAQAPTSIETIAADAATKGIYTMTGQFVGNDYYSLPNGIYVVDGKKVVK